jgi:hypothetical protein
MVGSVIRQATDATYGEIGEGLRLERIDQPSVLQPGSIRSSPSIKDQFGNDADVEHRNRLKIQTSHEGTVKYRRERCALPTAASAARK